MSPWKNVADINSNTSGHLHNDATGGGCTTKDTKRLRLSYWENLNPNIH